MRKVLSLFVFFGLLFGCSSPKPPDPYLLRHSPSNPEPTLFEETIVALDKDASKALYYVNHKQQRLPTGQIRVVFNLQNSSKKEDRWVDWKVVFYDENNFQVEETEWKLSHFPVREIITLAAQSIRKDAQNFSVILRSPEQ